MYQRLQSPPKLPAMRLGESDIGDSDLLAFALEFAGPRPAAAVTHLLDEFGDVELILASDPAELRSRGGLTTREVGILKLLNAFRADSRRGRLLN